MTIVYLIDRGDDASEKLQNHIKIERGILNRDIIKIKAGVNLIETSKLIDTTAEGPFEVYVPTLWEGTDIAAPFGPMMGRTLEKVMHEMTGKTFRFNFPFTVLQLIDVLRDKPTNKLLNGDCLHAEIEEEQCGLCLDCLEKYLCYTLLGFDTEELFLEDPISGYGGYERVFEVMTRLCFNQGTAIRPAKQDLAIGKLIVDNYFEGTLDERVCSAIDGRFSRMLTIY